MDWIWKYKTLLGGGHEGSREAPEGKGRIFVRVCTWGNLTPLAEIGVMRKR